MSELLQTPTSWPRILLERAAAIDPSDLDAAVKAGAYEALKTAVRAMTPGAVAGAVSASGLRGRGGAGYPTGLKWRAAAAAPAGPRYVVANGYGADPAVRTDRVLMESDPHAIIEGVALAAYAIGASRAWIALRSEATEAIRRLEAALAGATEAGFVGADVSTPAGRSRSRSGRSRAPTCSARRRSCSRPWRASADSPSSGRRTRPSRACSADPPWSRASRRSPPCPGSSGTARRPTPRSAHRFPGRSSSSSGGGRDGDRRGAARHDPPRARRTASAVGRPAPQGRPRRRPGGRVRASDLLDTPLPPPRRPPGRRSPSARAHRRRRRPSLHRRPRPALTRY